MTAKTSGNTKNDRYTKGKLMRLRKGELVKIAKEMGIPTDGIKQALVDRIIAEYDEEEEPQIEVVTTPQIKIVCPECDETLTKGMTKCPNCNYEFPEIDDEEDLEEEYECPDCGQTFTEPVPFCPDCGAEFDAIEEEVDEYECPDCHTIVAASEPVCPWCGLEFEAEEEDTYAAPFEVGGVTKEEEAAQLDEPAIFVSDAEYDEELDEIEITGEETEPEEGDEGYKAPFEAGGEVSTIKELEEEARYEAPFDVEEELLSEEAGRFETQTGEEEQKEEEKPKEMEARKKTGAYKTPFAVTGVVKSVADMEEEMKKLAEAQKEVKKGKEYDAEFKAGEEISEDEAKKFASEDIAPDEKGEYDEEDITFELEKEKQDVYEAPFKVGEEVEGEEPKEEMEFEPLEEEKTDHYEAPFEAGGEEQKEEVELQLEEEVAFEVAPEDEHYEGPFEEDKQTQKEPEEVEFTPEEDEGAMDDKAYSAPFISGDEISEESLQEFERTESPEESQEDVFFEPVEEKVEEGAYNVPFEVVRDVKEPPEKGEYDAPFETGGEVGEEETKEYESPKESQGHEISEPYTEGEFEIEEGAYKIPFEEGGIPEEELESWPSEYEPEEESLQARGIEDEESGEAGYTMGMTNGLSERETGMTNGLTNGLSNGLTNGLTNGLRRGRQGLTNGLTNGITNGITNGLRVMKAGITNGLTNGNGITNGLGGSKKILESKKSRIGLIVVPILIFALIFAPYIMVDLSEPPAAVIIDGEFRDWRDTEIISEEMADQGFNPNIDIKGYGVVSELFELAFYLEVEGNMLAGEPEPESRFDSVFIFIDMDQDPNSGYLIKGIGADYMIQVLGWKQNIYTQVIKEYDSEDINWNDWVGFGTAVGAVEGSKLEVKVDFNKIGMENGDEVDVLFYMQDYQNNEDYSDTIVSNSPGVLSVTQQAVAPELIDDLNRTDNEMLRLDIKAMNSDITIHEINVNLLGVSEYDIADVYINSSSDTYQSGASVGDVFTFSPGIDLTEGNSITLFVTVDIDENAMDGSSVGFRIMNNHDITTDQGTVSLETVKPEDGFYDVSYIFAIPDEIVIDGAFGDWMDSLIEYDFTQDISDPNLDLIEYSVSNTSADVNFYMRVDGEYLGGDGVPFENTASAIGVPGPVTPPTPDSPTPISASGVDITYIFIDSDNRVLSGYRYRTMGADYLIEIRGKNGQIISKMYSKWFGNSPDDWKWVPQGAIDAKTDSSRIETQLSKNALDITGKFTVFYQTTDWSGQKRDFSENKTTRAGPRLALRGTRYTSDVITCVTGTTPDVTNGEVGNPLGEWDDATVVSVTNLMIYIKMDATFFYVGIETKDNNNNNNDYCGIYFETNHTDNGVTDVADKRLHTIKESGTWNDYWTLGTISGWGTPGFPPANHEIYEYIGGPGSFMEYEARIPLTTLNEFGLFDEDYERIGFAIIVENGSSQHGEWPEGAIDEPDPFSIPNIYWGELEIPEYKDILVPTVSMIIIGAIYRRKRKNN